MSDQVVQPIIDDENLPSVKDNNQPFFDDYHEPIIDNNNQHDNEPGDASQGADQDLNSVRENLEDVGEGGPQMRTMGWMDDNFEELHCMARLEDAQDAFIIYHSTPKSFTR